MLYIGTQIIPKRRKKRLQSLEMSVQILCYFYNLILIIFPLAES